LSIRAHFIQGAPVLTPLPGCTPLKPGSATLPFFGVQPALLDDEGRELNGPAIGHLVFKSPWPAMMRTVDGNHHRFQSTYFTRFPGYYCAGDGKSRLSARLLLARSFVLDALDGADN
jgi:acetyl-CoA synthetase